MYLAEETAALLLLNGADISMEDRVRPHQCPDVIKPYFVIVRMDFIALGIFQGGCCDRRYVNCAWC